MKSSLLRYKIYEYMRDTDQIEESSSNTKRLLNRLKEKDADALAYCRRKEAEELTEVREAKEGRHHHDNKTKREILVNEISQAIYWETLMSVAEYVSYEEFAEEERIAALLADVSLEKIDSKEEITVQEVIEHDLLDMRRKDYLREMIDRDYTFN